jgi:hypothetical protein
VCLIEKKSGSDIIFCNRIFYKISGQSGETVKELGFQGRKRTGSWDPWKVAMASLSVWPVQREDVERDGEFSPWLDITRSLY